MELAQDLTLSFALGVQHGLDRIQGQVYLVLILGESDQQIEPRNRAVGGDGDPVGRLQLLIERATEVAQGTTQTLPPGEGEIEHQEQATVGGVGAVESRFKIRCHARRCSIPRHPIS